MSQNAPSFVQIDIRDVIKRYGSHNVLDGVSLQIRHAEIACLIGPSGSGKSTLLRTINALTPVDAGSITVAGIEVTHKQLDHLQLRRQVGMVFQSYNLFPHLTVMQNITLAPTTVLGEDPDSVRERARELLRRIHLEKKENAYPGQLSGGQQQRVAIARSLAMRPQVMMFDEVTAALDPETVKKVLLTIRDVAASGMTCLIVTHEMSFAREIADTVYFTDGGLIIESGPPEQIFGQPQDPRTRRFLERVL